MIGFTERLNTVQAAVGRIQLKRLDSWNESRRQIASKYDALLSDLDTVVTPPTKSSVANPVYHVYAARCQRRDDLRAWLLGQGVETGIHYQDPIHLQPVYQKYSDITAASSPTPKRSAETSLASQSIPHSPWTKLGSSAKVSTNSIVGRTETD